MSRSQRRLGATLVTVSLAAALTAPAPASAQTQMLASGEPGPVSLLNFAGGSEAAPTSHADVSQAAVECDVSARGRRAVFAGALAWAPDATAGLHNDWRYVRVAAGAVDEQGRTRTGQVSPYYAAYDDRAATLPPVAVVLPHDGESYTPVMVVQFFDATYRLTGTTIVGAQTGAWRIRLPTPGFGEYWYVAGTDLVQCD